MSASVQINVEEFSKVLRAWTIKSEQELAKALNRRMFFLLVRLYALVPPKNPQEARAKITEYMNAEVGPAKFSKRTGKPLGKNRIFRRVNLIAQARAKEAGHKGLYGKTMRRASGSIRRHAIGSVGYLKAGVVRAIKFMNGHFTQWGGRTKKSNGREINPNGALVKIGAEYGIFASAGNVTIFKGAKAFGYPANPGVNPRAIVGLSIGLGGGGGVAKLPDPMGRVSEIYDTAMAKAMADEMTELRNHLSDVIDDCADKACAESPNGRAD